MAIDVFEAAFAKRSVVHTPEHDVESFIWVLGYCILRSLYNKAYAIKKAGPEYISMKPSFIEAFGSLSLRGILSSRRAANPFNWCSKKISGPMEPFFEEHISDPLRRLLRAFQSYVDQRQVEEEDEEYRRRDGLVSVRPLTHDILRRWITGAITRLQEDPSRDRSR